MTSISVIGTGNMGSAIAALAAKGGASVQILDRDASKARDAAAPLGATSGVFGDEPTGDIVVLAVPYAALDDVVETYGRRLDGKTVVDISNPVDFTTFDGLVVTPDSSAAADLQARLPGTKVVKAFNTNFAATLASGSLGGEPTTIVIAGDDDTAKSELAAVFSSAGLRVADAGSLKRARELEAAGFLQMVLAVRQHISWSGGFIVHA